jgi:arylsulfatase A-like enzyme
MASDRVLCASVEPREVESKDAGWPKGWRGRLACFLLGCLVAGACVAALEVLWTILLPLLPIPELKRQALLPPRSTAAFIGAALLLDIGLSLAIATAAALPVVLLLRGRPEWSLRAGILCAGAPLMAVFAVVWVSLLSPGSLFRASTLVWMGATSLWLFGSLFVLLGVARSGGTPLRAAMRVVTLAVLLPLATASLLHGAIPYPEETERGRPEPGLPNIVLVTLDTLRADQLAPWAEGGAKTPILSRLVREGVLFERAMSPVPHTTPSHVSMFTSVYPFEHGARNGIPMRTDLATLPTELRRHGYTTAAFVSAYTTKSHTTGLGHAFDVYSDSLHADLDWISRDDMEPLVVTRLIGRYGGNQVSAPVVNRRLERWLERVGPEDAPFFLWLHYFDAHDPYTPSPRYAALYPPTDDSSAARRLAGYRAEITYLDHRLGDALDLLNRAQLLDDAILVVTSDHGESFGEPHPHVDHAHGAHLYDSVMWVPLVFWGPPRVAIGRRVAEQVELLDIAPTLLELSGLPAPEGFGGRSLSPALATEATSIGPARAFAQTRTLKRPRRFALRTSDWKLVHNPDDEEQELFDLRADPGETRDLSSEHPDRVRELRAELEFIVSGDKAQQPDVEDLDPETREHLKALGYIDE